MPAGFEQNARIENAASARITESGLNFIAANVGGLAGNLLGDQATANAGVIEFPIPESNTSGTGYNITICPGGPDAANGKCVAEINIGAAQFTITTATPHNIVASGPVPIRLKNLPLDGEVLWFIPVSTSAALSGGGNNDCNPSTMSFKNVNVTARISITVERDPNHNARLGYSKLKIEELTIDEGQLTDGIHFCGGGLTSAAFNALKGILAPSLLGGFTGTMGETLNEQLCMKADPAGGTTCPSGTNADDGDICRYQDNSCVSIMLGTDGNMDLGPMLASISPGTTGGLDFLFAVGGNAGGDLDPIANGATLGLLGGALPRPTSNCVKPANIPMPTGIPIPNELKGNSLTGWTGQGPHVGFALSERFLNYALGGVYDSGLLCIGASTEQIPQLSSGLFSLLVPSLTTLTFQKQTAPIAVAIRPQKPPTITMGGATNMDDDPLMTLRLDQAMIDFYVWSSDRFIRAFTAQFDLRIPISLQVSPAGLTPMLEKIYVENPSVTNAQLLREDPSAIGGALASVIEAMAGDFLGGFDPIDVSGALASMGLTLELQQDSIKKLSQGSDNYLGVFAAFGLAPSTTSLESDTSIALVNKFATSEGFRLTTHNEHNRPRVIVRASSTLAYGSNSVEYSYRIGKGLWHMWTTNPEIVIDDGILILQGEHVVSVKSRLAGQPMTEDRTPAQLQFRLDVDAPMLSLTLEEGSTRIEAHDVVSAQESLLARYRFDDGALSEWMPLAKLDTIAWPDDARKIEVQVQDEEGNVASKQQGLIRGRPDKSLAPDAGSACGCSVPGSSGGSFGALGLVAAAGLLGALSRRRRRAKAAPSPFRSAAGWLGSIGLMLLAGSWSGCSCSDDTEVAEPTPEPQPDAGEEGGTDPVCGEPGGDECIVLEPGLVGSYTSAAAAPDGSIWVSGYNEGDWDNEVSYGDLVVGKWDQGAGKVTWQSIDGVPSSPEPDGTIYDIENSWRGGQDSAGEDVGTWTSLALDGANPRVAYMDVTKKALKFASFDGSAWQTSTVMDLDKFVGEAGRYAKMLIVDGKPVIAFQVIETGDAGFAKSKVVLARGNGPTPAAAGDWTFEDVAVSEETPCRNHLCVDTQKCVASTLQCQPRSDGCDPKCPSGQACIAGVCEAILDATKIDSYPEAIGVYISMAQGPQGELGIVYYDRIHGNLMQARQDAGAWTNRILAGQEGEPAQDTGDVGIGASLTIDANGDWHISYVDGFKESLLYMFVAQGTEAPVIETVDEGVGIDGQPFDDGQHIVGDDSFITVAPTFDVRIAYQDATAGTLRFAVGAPGGPQGHTWTVRVIAQDGFGGFFPQQVMSNSATQLVNWWRKGGAKIEGDVRVIAP